jgi:hypothetical protein
MPGSSTTASVALQIIHQNEDQDNARLSQVVVLATVGHQAFRLYRRLLLRAKLDAADELR